MKELTHASVAELSALLSKKEVSAKEIAQAYLDKIEDKKSLNAFPDVDLMQFDYVLDCIDTVSAKLLLIRCCKKAGAVSAL